MQKELHSNFILIRRTWAIVTCLQKQGGLFDGDTMFTDALTEVNKHTRQAHDRAKELLTELKGKATADALEQIPHNTLRSGLFDEGLRALESCIKTVKDLAKPAEMAPPLYMLLVHLSAELRNARLWLSVAQANEAFGNTTGTRPTDRKAGPEKGNS